MGKNIQLGDDSGWLPLYTAIRLNVTWMWNADYEQGFSGM